MPSLAACGVSLQATNSSLELSDFWEMVTCQPCLQTTLKFEELVLSRNFRNLGAIPERLRKEGLRARWNAASANGDGNTMTQIIAFFKAVHGGQEMSTTGSDDHDNGKPNIFDYATKELSQDAMICWLIRWSGERAGTDEERALKSLGQNFVSAMLSKHNISLSGEIKTVEIHQQDHGIDVLTRIHDESGKQHVLLIEDKTGTKDHSNQLLRYCDAVRSGKTELGMVSGCWPMYLKTGNYSSHHAREVESKTSSGDQPGYKMYDRKDFLSVLNLYQGDYPLVKQFRSRLRKFEDEFDSWHNWKLKEKESWSWESWEGFYWALENKFSQSSKKETPGLLDWGYVPNPKGGFLGLWWFPFGWNDKYTLYLQLEVVPDDPSRQELCFKVEAGEDNRTAADYHELVRLAAESQGVSIERPRMRTGATMTVGRWPGDWLVFDVDGHPDLLQTAGTLWRAQGILKVAMKTDVAP